MFPLFADAALDSSTTPVVVAFALALVGLAVQFYPIPHPRIAKAAACACYVVALEIVLALVLPLVLFLVAVFVGLVVWIAYGVHLFRQKPGVLRLLLAEIHAGERLLTEARQPETVATIAQVDDFMNRVTTWYDSVTTTLIAHDDRQRLDTWARIDWHRGRPQPRDREEAFTYLVRPLWERLEMLEDFCRELTKENKQ